MWVGLRSNGARPATWPYMARCLCQFVDHCAVFAKAIVGDNGVSLLYIYANLNVVAVTWSMNVLRPCLCILFVATL